MKRRKTGNANLFFIEFLIVLFFFLIISAICLKVFALAYRTTRDADALSHAQILASSVLEVCKSGEDLTDYYPEGAWQEVSASEDGSSVFILTLDADFSSCSASDAGAAYLLTADISTDGHDSEISISVNQADGTIVYELAAGFHTPFSKEEILS